MIRYIHFSRSLEKIIRGLRKTGRKTQLAARKYEAIINDIKKFGCRHETVSGKRTRNGELRIKNCIKYDLGGGYRLVTIRFSCHLFIAFAGSHDDTDQWMEHHRYDTFAPDNVLYRSEEVCIPRGHKLPTSTQAAQLSFIQPDTSQAEESEWANENTIDDQYEDDLNAKLNESQLKSIFNGLFVNAL